MHGHRYEERHNKAINSLRGRQHRAGVASRGACRSLGCRGGAVAAVNTLFPGMAGCCCAQMTLPTRLTLELVADRLKHVSRRAGREFERDPYRSLVDISDIDRGVAIRRWPGRQP